MAKTSIPASTVRDAAGVLSNSEHIPEGANTGRGLSEAEYNQNVDNLRSQLKSPHFFSMTGIPKFGKNWLDNFIPDEDLQNTFLTSEVVRNVIMLQCVYYTSVYSDIVRAYRTGQLQPTPSAKSPPLFTGSAGQRSRGDATPV